jgi:hypothetical protein
VQDLVEKVKICVYHLKTLNLCNKENQKMEATAPMSNLQLELLKIYATNISDEDLLAIKRMLAKFFMEKAIERADEIWEQRGYNNELMQEWQQE